ncbi:MAG: hypothetical protein E7331_08065 [Clostridiales bacterium]|nr:hypothetical protein [Clostridiales bacterium]
MSIFGKSKREQELEMENFRLRRRVKDLVERSDDKDSFFCEMISDGLRHGSSLAAKHMSDRKKYLNENKK